MNWTAIGAIGEFLGAVAVVITLLYLAKQIRQSSLAVEVSALRDTTAQWNQWSGILASSPDLAEIVTRGNHSYKDLPEADAMRYGAYVQMFFDDVESYRALAHDHQVDRDMHVVEKIIRRRICINGFAEWWDDNTDDYDKDFVAWVNGLRPD